MDIFAIWYVIKNKPIMSRLSLIAQQQHFVQAGYEPGPARTFLDRGIALWVPDLDGGSVLHIAPTPKAEYYNHTTGVFVALPDPAFARTESLQLLRIVLPISASSPILLLGGPTIPEMEVFDPDTKTFSTLPTGMDLPAEAAVGGGGWVRGKSTAVVGGTTRVLMLVHDANPTTVWQMDFGSNADGSLATPWAPLYTLTRQFPFGSLVWLGVNNIEIIVYGGAARRLVEYQTNGAMMESSPAWHPAYNTCTTVFPDGRVLLLSWHISSFGSMDSINVYDPRKADFEARYENGPGPVNSQYLSGGYSVLLPDNQTHFAIGINQYISLFQPDIDAPNLGTEILYPPTKQGLIVKAPPGGITTSVAAALPSPSDRFAVLMIGTDGLASYYNVVL
jgi:hypothetical protein